MVAGLIARVPIKWPSVVSAMFRSFETVSVSQEAFSVECSMPNSATSKVYNKSAGFLVAIVVRSFSPACRSADEQRKSPTRRTAK